MTTIDNDVMVRFNAIATISKKNSNRSLQISVITETVIVVGVVETDVTIIVPTGDRKTGVVVVDSIVVTVGMVVVVEEEIG